MHKKTILSLFIIIVISIMTLVGIDKPNLTRAKNSNEVTHFLPMISGTFSLSISPFVTNIVEPGVMTDIVDPGDGRLFIATRDGRVQISSPDGTLQTELLLDIQTKVLDDGNESGLVGLAVHPDFASNGYIYVFYVENIGTSFWAVVARYHVESTGVADRASEKRLLHIELPTLRHHAGAMHFGPNDGYLYIAVGDGGVQFDRDANAQSTQTLLGKILRIDVDSAFPYAIPPDNPLAGDPLNRGEIWALGLRNPWRFSFDQETGDMYIGDVGEATYEEINFIPATSTGGKNFGWACKEGPIAFNPKMCDPAITYTEPIYHYSQDNCRAVIGGYVYHGSLIPEITGQYIFADVCNGVIMSLIPIGDQIWIPYEWGYLGQRFTTFGQSSDGEILLGAYDRTVYKLTKSGAND